MELRGSMRLCWGPHRQDLVTSDFVFSEVSLQDAISSKRAAYHSVFLNFGENLYYTISTENEARMAAVMVFLFQTKDFDSDGWISEAKQMEENAGSDRETEESGNDSDEWSDEF